MNLGRNAIEAIPSGSEGKIRYNLGSSTLTGPVLIGGKPAKPGTYTTINVSDTGSGISERSPTTLFAPYFTTKKEGTGLGLHIVHSIVEAHNGHVGVASSHEGATFTIYLPCAEK